MMEIIGFVALLLLGLYLCFAGVVVNLASQGFAGKWEPVGVVILLVGGIIIWFAWQYKPFQIVAA